jgi:hypothetical protein
MDERGVIASSHEAAHASTAICLGWDVWRVSRSSSLEANTYITPRVDGDVRERGLELAMIALAPFVCNAVGGAEHDLRLLADLAENGVQLGEAKRRLEKLTTTDRHHDLRVKFGNALMSSLEIDEDEIAELITET